MTQTALARKAELEEALGRIVKNLVERYRPRCIILFGSLARGKCGEWSDIDLCVIKETESPWLQRVAEVLEIIDSDEAVDVLVYRPSEWREMLQQGNYFLRDEVLGAGRILHGDPDGLAPGS